MVEVDVFILPFTFLSTRPGLPETAGLAGGGELVAVSSSG